MEKVESTGAIYSHWLALQLYDLIQQQGSKESTRGGYEFSIGGATIQLDCSSLERMVACVQSIAAMHNAPSQRRGRGTMSDTALQSSELTVTALLCRELDRFLFPDARVGACLHQLPTRVRHSTPDRADFYIVKLGGDHLPCTTPIGVSDYKQHDEGGATIESFGYSAELMSTGHDLDDYVVHLVFPWTSHVLKLQLHLGLHGRVLVIDIHKANRVADEALKVLFCAMYAAVHVCIRQSLTSPSPCISPWQTLSLSNALTRHSSHKVPCRVFEKEGVVYKLYDTKVDAPMFVLAKDYLPGAELQNLSSDERFQCLKYAFIEDCGTKTPSQFASVLKQLHDIHRRGFVHADIREANIVFGPTSARAQLIDFDLAAAEGTAYPQDYNHRQIYERHSKARAGNTRAASHDRFALSQIMSNAGCSQQYVMAVRGCGSLSAIADAILEGERD